MAKKITTFEHAPYSPDLAPCDFWLFPTLKSKLAECSFDMEEELKKNVEAILKDLSKDDLQFVFETWYKRMQKSINVAGHYVEK